MADQEFETGPSVAVYSGRRIVVLTLLLSLTVVPLFVLFMTHYAGAKVRSSVARAQDSMRTLATAIESYYVDNMEYPAMAMDHIWAAGAYTLPADVPVSRTFRMRNESQMMTLTTPIGYVVAYPVDPFREVKGTTFSYFNAGHGWLLASWGPDVDQQSGGDLQMQRGDIFYSVATEAIQVFDGVTTHTMRRRITMPDPGVESVYDPTVRQPSDHLLTGNHNEFGEGAFTYDPTNGLFSQGDIWRVKQ
jgi:hypothetical protein